MIVVNLNKSYPEFAAALGQSGKKDPNEILMRDLRPLAAITAGDWFRITDLRARQYGDVLVGCFAAQVVSIYHIVGWEQQPDQTIRFEVKPAIEWATMLGTGQPGGPWKQGEARGSRFVDSASYRERYERPTTKGRDTASWKRLTGELVLRHQGLIEREPIPVESVAHPAHMTVEWPGIPPIGLQFTSTGILEIEVPQGLRTRVVHAKDITASDQQIAAKLGVSVSTVRRWKRR